MYANLSLQQSPPFSVPARFFVTAPLFGIVASLILLFNGPETLSSRWTPAMLSITHAIVLGFLATVMLGALQQILPVVAGVSISRPRRTATVVYLLWVPGVAALTGTFLYPSPSLIFTALFLISGAVLVFAGAVIYSLGKSVAAGNSSVQGIKLAVFSLVITLLFGVVLALGHAGTIPLYRPALTDLHMTWGFIGWIGVLVITVAWQVVPMFQITPSFPVWMRRLTIPLVLILLLVKSLLYWTGSVAVAGYTVDVLIAVCLIIFALTTLHLQKHSRRRLRDNHKIFWRLSMVGLILAVLLWTAGQIMDNATLFLLAGMVFVLGFAMSVVTGMLLKIIAFLVWLHLQQQKQKSLDEGNTPVEVPKMNAIVSRHTGTRLLLLLIAAQSIMLAALVFPDWFTVSAALIWLLLYAALAGVLARVCLRYYRYGFTAGNGPEGMRSEAGS